MKKTLLLILGWLAVVPAALAAPPEAEPRLAAAVHGAKVADDAFAKAFVANDLAAVVALYAPEAKLFPPDSAVATGAGIRESFAGLFANYTIMAFKTLDATYETSGTLSVGWGRFTMTVTPKKGGAPVVMEGRFTSVAKKIGGKWLYVSDHASFTPAPPAPQVPAPTSMPGRR
jgi:ketosteroid isomerase-like protein